MRVADGRTSYNVEIMTSVEGPVHRYKEQLVLPCSVFGGAHDEMPGGGHDINKSQGGIVFENEEVALQLLQALELYFDEEVITVRKEVTTWFYQVCSSLLLKWKYRNRKVKIDGQG